MSAHVDVSFEDLLAMVAFRLDISERDAMALPAENMRALVNSQINNMGTPHEFIDYLVHARLHAIEIADGERSTLQDEYDDISRRYRLYLTDWMEAVDTRNAAG